MTARLFVTLVAISAGPLTAGVYYVGDVAMVTTHPDYIAPHAILHPIGWTGGAGIREVRVCAIAELKPPTRRAVFMWNNLTPMVGNCGPSARGTAVHNFFGWFTTGSEHQPTTLGLPLTRVLRTLGVSSLIQTTAVLSYYGSREAASLALYRIFAKPRCLTDVGRKGAVRFYYGER